MTLSSEEIARKIEELQALLLDAKKKEAEDRLKNEVVSLYGFRMIRNELKFNYRPRRADVTACFNSFGISTASLVDLALDPHMWDEVESALKTLPNIDLSNITDEMRDTWRNYQPPPGVLIKFDGAGNYIIFENQSHVYIESILHSNAEFMVVQSTGRKVLHPSNIWVLEDILNAIRSKHPLEDIHLDDPVKKLYESYLASAARLERLNDQEYVPEKDYVFNGFTFRHYQTQCLEMLLETDGKLIVALDMGLGKTPVSLAFINETLKTNPKTKFLIVCPSSLRPNWSKQVRKFMPHVKTLQLFDQMPSAYYMNQLITGDESIIYISYETLRYKTTVEQEGKAANETKKVFPWAVALSMIGLTGHELRLICDEAHYYKNPETSNAQSIFAITNARSITPLTGTPMKNGPKDLHSLVKSVNPVLAGTNAGWISFHTFDNGRMARNPEKLRKVLAPIMFRRRTKDVIKDIPGINRITLEHSLSPKAKTSYQDVINGLYSQLDKWDGDRSNSMAVNGILSQMMRMKQVCSEDKIDFAAERALETYDSDESDYRKVIIFSQFANEPPIVPKIAAKLGGESLWFTGDNPPDERFAIVERFQKDPSIHFLVASTKSAMEGLDITAAGHIIFVDLMWTPTDHTQAEGRAYARMSDLHGITSTYIVAENTIEEDIVQLLYDKMRTNAQVVDGMTDESSIAMDVLALLKSMRG